MSVEPLSDPRRFFSFFWSNFRIKFLQLLETDGKSGKETLVFKMFLNVAFLSDPLKGVFPYWRRE